MNTNKLMPIRSNTVNSGKQVRQQSSALDKLDLNSPDFDAEQYVRNLLREKGIDDLVAVEEDMVFVY
jgi:hypothetical protein